MKTTHWDPIGSRNLVRLAKTILFAGAIVSHSVLLHGQAAATSPPPAPAEDAQTDVEMVVLSPFVVDGSTDVGYLATSTLAGTRIRTDLADVGSSISVITKEMLTDLGATNNETVLAYAVNTEVGGARGNYSGGVTGSSERYQEQNLFANPNGNTRVRGLTNADNTRNYFLTDIPWDGYTVDRVDLQRGPNAILFGLGSPAGVVNATTNAAEFRNQGSFEVGFDKFGTQRFVLDYNRELVPRQLAVRVALLRNDQQFRQDPAFQLDQRVHGAIKYRPEAFNRPGVRFEVSANYEHGRLRSNRPRTITQGDRLSGFWDSNGAGGVNRALFDPYGTELNPNETPHIGGGGLGSIVSMKNSNRSTAWVKPDTDSFLARRPDGTIETETLENFDAIPFAGGGAVSIESFPTFANKAGLIFADFGAYYPKTITDPSIYDFYNKLIDGSNKREWTDWDVFEISLSNTFFNDSLGYDISHFEQRLDRGQWSVLGWDNTIFMDINSTTSENVPNPDVGRPYIQVENRDFGNGTVRSDRDATRGTVFGEYDFGKRREGFLARVLGVHRLTGVLSEENVESDTRTYRIGDLDPASKRLFAPFGTIEGPEMMSTGFRYYLSDDLRGRSGVAGSNLSNLAEPVYDRLGGPITVHRFDNTWTAGPGVDPAAAWANPFRPLDATLTQAQNPANYRGWIDTPANFVTIFNKDPVGDMTARDYLTSSGNLVDFNVKSLVGVWQGYFWDKAIIGTYGYREDRAHNYNYLSADRNGTGRLDTRSADLRPATYNFSNPGAKVIDLDTITRNWSVAVHLNRLLGERDFLPVNVSLYYNKGENFQPLAGRIDAFARPLAPPQGNTTEKSVLIATKDGKYSLRATDYDTTVLNASSTGSVGNMWALEQALFDPANYARLWRSGDASDQGYIDAGGDLARLKTSILPAWFQFEKDLEAAYPEYVNAWIKQGGSSPWGTEDNGNVSAGSPAGFAFTEDSHSKGYEFEFTANPTANWRIAVNASKTTATRENVPGPAFKEVAAFVNDAIMNTDVGLTPMWWPENTGGVRGTLPWLLFRPGYLANAALNGQSAPDIREWRWNALTNYSFAEGRLKGVGVGGGYRWEDTAVIGYAPMKTDTGDNAVNLDAPFRTSVEGTLDLWLSYSRKISEKVNWKIQLNAYNVFGRNELVPLSASVDYAALGSTVLTPTTVIPMMGSGFRIKEGMSWQISNRFEF